MTPVTSAELMRQLLKLAAALTAAIVVAALLVSFVLRRVKKLRSLRELPSSVLLRLASIAAIIVVGMCFLEFLAAYTRVLLRDLHRFTG